MSLSAIARNWITAFLYPKPFIGILYLPRFFRHLMKYRSQVRESRIRLTDLQPCLGDWCSNTPFDSHYFYQGAWLSRHVSENNPQTHVDIGSSVLTISVLSGWVETVFLDYRPLKTRLSGLNSLAGDLLSLPFKDRSLKSLSCLHVIEHIGLGRYGDPINPGGMNQATAELQRVLMPGGRLYLSLPVGRERICFNAHRICAPETIAGTFAGLTVVDFSYVDDSGIFHEHADMGSSNRLEYGCGMFVFERP